MTAARIAVVGAGVAGLAAAATIRRDAPDVDVIVLEERTRVGGLVDTEHTPDGFVIEHGADALLTTKPWAIAAARSFAAGDALVTEGPAPRRSFVSTPGGLVPLPSIFAGATATTALSLLRTPLLSTAGKLRTALEPLVPPRRSTEDESVRAFVARRFGPELADAVVEPLMGGIYGQRTDRLSASACLPRLHALEEKHRSVVLGMRSLLRARRRQEGEPLPAMVTFRHGMQALPRALHEGLGDRVVLGTTVQELARRGVAGFELVTSQGLLACDGVVLATPAWATAPLLANLAPDVAQVLAAVDHKAFICVSLAFERRQVSHPLDGTGWVRGTDDRRTTLACTWASQKWWGRAPRGALLVRSMLPCDVADDDDVVGMARADLRDLLGVTAPPLLTRIRRLPRATPIYEVGHGARMAAALAGADAIGALALAGNAYAGVGVPDCAVSGEVAARVILAHIAARDRAARPRL